MNAPVPPQATRPRGDGTPVALIVDGDATSRRFVELALERSGTFVVESAKDAASALEILRSARVDLIISDTDLVDTGGLAFFRRLSHESRLRSVPFVFLSADRAVETKVAALRAGVDEYLTKPCDVAELIARMESLVSKQQRVREALRQRSYALAGDFAAMAFPEFVGIVEMGRRSGVLSVVTTTGVGNVHFDAGAIVHVAFGNLCGETAFQEIFAAPAGHFEFTPGPCSVRPEDHTIHASVTALIMEAARVMDDSARISVNPPPRAVVSPRRLATRPPFAENERVPALDAEPLLAAQYELALRDPFALAEMRVWSHADLGRWTRREVGRDRLHVVLVAGLSEGVSAMLALAGAPSERWVVDSLSPDQKIFGLTFYLRHERTVDVVLVDAADPAATLRALQRTPAIVLVAPPDGDLLSLGTAARVGLEDLLESLSSPAVVAVGNASLAQGMNAMRRVVDRPGETMVRCTVGALGEGADDLRGLLVKGIRLWASNAPPSTVPPPTRDKAIRPSASIPLAPRRPRNEGRF